MGNSRIADDYIESVDNTAILAAYTLSKKLRVYRISINWNLQPQANPQQPPIPPNNVRLIVKRLKVENLASPAEIPNMDMSKAFLTHLEVMPPTFSGPNVHQYFPTTIMAVYSVMNMLTPSSVIIRWILRETQGSLHPSFDQLGVRRGSVSTLNTKEVCPLFHEINILSNSLNIHSLSSTAYLRIC